MDDTPETQSDATTQELRELREKAERFDRFTRSLPAMLYDYIINHDGISHCLYCSAYSLELLGIPPEDFLADMDRFWNLIHPDDLTRFRELDLKTNREEVTFSMDTRVVLASGKEKWIRVSSKKNPPQGDQPAIWSGYMIDISGTKQLELMLQEQATHDALTGLGNRHYFQRHFRDELLRKDRYQRDSAVLLLDLDHFKKVNDRYGHDAGDFVLMRVSQLVKAQLREVDVPARWGGEEFCILLPETTLDDALAAAERIRAGLAREPLDYQGEAIEVTASIGVTTLNADDRRIEPVIKRADAALYRAKRDGRNRVAHG
ncbi:sensor domain-containing diguanylate cyclase [Sedimenticola selenatireducens]|uniref:sensor domain-containing diguanylate cyclase n=1 Tax=Sedimenticola selenatireducens TaxID=191960 RepID=UPI002AAC28BD|nr:sensor domain-containing diguanylate cyclase [Sedimenticola selenatireducens]